MIASHGAKFDELMAPEIKKLARKFQDKTPEQMTLLENGTIHKAVNKHLSTYFTNVSNALDTPRKIDIEGIANLLSRTVVQENIAKAVVLADEKKMVKSGMGMGG